MSWIPTDNPVSVADKRRAFAERIRSRKFTTVPGVYDCISLRIADTIGFDAVYLTGYGTIASQLGLPDAGLASFGEVLPIVRRFSDYSNAPVIADADTGFGGDLNLSRTVSEYEKSGACAIQIEDQVSPKKCGHTPGRSIVPSEEMVTRIRIADDTRRDCNMLIVARTDARSSHGLDEALERGVLYCQAGADVIFIESPESKAEFRRIGQEIDAPLVANMVEGGRSPLLSSAQLRDLGFTISIHPIMSLLAAAKAVRTSLEHLADTGGSAGAACELEKFENLNQLTGFPQVWDFESRWTDKSVV